MTIAELHGKISGTGKNVHDRLEDLLTSDVFGSILYGICSTLEYLRRLRFCRNFVLFQDLV